MNELNAKLFDTFPIQIFYSGTFSRYLHSRSTPSLKVLPLGWNSLNIFAISLELFEYLCNIFGILLGIFGISLKVLPWGWNPPVVASGQCLLPLPHTSLSSLYCIIAQHSHFHTRPLNLQLHLLEILCFYLLFQGSWSPSASASSSFKQAPAPLASVSPSSPSPSSGGLVVAYLPSQVHSSSNPYYWSYSRFSVD